MVNRARRLQTGVWAAGGCTRLNEFAGELHEFAGELYEFAGELYESAGELYEFAGELLREQKEEIGTRIKDKVEN